MTSFTHTVLLYKFVKSNIFYFNVKFFSSSNESSLNQNNALHNYDNDMLPNGSQNGAKNKLLWRARSVAAAFSPSSKMKSTLVQSYSQYSSNLLLQSNPENNNNSSSSSQVDYR